MSRTLFAALLTLMLFAWTAAAQDEAETSAEQPATAANELKTFEQRASYFFGQVFGQG